MDDSQKYFYINIRGYLGQEGSNEIGATPIPMTSGARKTEITMQDAENVVDRVIGKLVSCQDV